MLDVTGRERGALTSNGGRRAVVIGGGIAGLLAARVLAEHFDRVTVVERDRPPLGPEFRPGVPQSRHVHALFVRGRILLERLFPGFGAELAAAGAERLEWPADILWYGPFGWGGRARLGLVTYSSGRELLEWIVRRRLARDARVEFVDGHQVVELVGDRAGGVEGVVLRRHGGRESLDAPTIVVRADLVVDASGRDSRAPRWLQLLGFQAPAETVVNAFLGYASRYYHRPPGEARPWKVADRPARTTARDSKRHPGAARRRPLDLHAGRSGPRLSAERRGGVPPLRA